jgi:hypothetical protein
LGAHPCCVTVSQVVRQDPFSQVKGLQLAGGAALFRQLPAPSHSRACTDPPPAAQTPPQL